MKRWLLACAVWLVFSCVAVQADYFIIKVNLAGTKDKFDPNNPFGLSTGNPGQGGAGMQQGGMQGMPSGMPGRGGRGGMGAGLGMGMAGGPGMSPGMGMAGGPGMGPGAPAGGMQGSGGGMGPGAPVGGMGGGPGAGKPGMGFGGGRGGFQGGGMGMGFQGGGAGMGFQGGGMGMPGGAGGGMLFNQMSGDDDDPESAPLLVSAIIEVPHDQVKQLVSGRPRIKHKWGETTLFLDSNNGEIEIKQILLPTVHQQYTIKKNKIKETDADRADKLLDLAQWSLAHGLFDEVPKIMKDLAGVNPKLPVVVTFQKVEADLAKEIKRDDAGLRWRDKLGEFKEERSKHYILCYNANGEQQAKGRIARLEDNMRGFYYWFALRGKALPVPDHRMIAFLVKDKETFKSQHKEIFDDDELIADGYFDRSENIIVFSAAHLDEAYDALLKITKRYDKYDQRLLLMGKNPDPTSLIANESAHAQTLTLLKKAMQDESEITSVSFEGTRQLLCELGNFPKGVEIPKWFDFGMASLFETPKGAFWHGTGSQNQTYLAQFKFWNEEKKIEKASPDGMSPAGVALGSVVTDRYFRRVLDAKNKENSENKARTLSWALVYYLADKKLDGLQKYCQELGQLPRDLQLNDEVLQLAFARAFGLTDAAKPNEIDRNRWTVFANDWFKTMNDTTLEVDEVRQSMRKKKLTTGKPGDPANKKSDDPNTFIGP